MGIIDLAVKGVKKAGKKAGKKVAEEATEKAAKKALPTAAKAAAARPTRVLAAGETRTIPARVAFDPRMETRKGEQHKVADMVVDLSARRVPDAPPVSIFDMEGKPFITSMSDMSAAGDDIVGVNGKALNNPVKRMGGQDYMFDNPGSVWASDLGPAGRHLELARMLKAQTGEDPLFLPWTMGPTSVDFAHMPRELMLQYAAANMGRNSKRKLAGDIRGIIPDFKDIEDPASLERFREATGKQRGSLNRLLDTYRDDGGMGMGAARLATTDLGQIGAPLTSLRNVGTIRAGAALSPSTHPSYRTSIPGEGIGRLKERIGALDLLPELADDAGLTGPFDFPVGVNPGVKSPMRSLQMSPKTGIVTGSALRRMQDRLSRRYKRGGSVKRKTAALAEKYEL